MPEEIIGAEVQEVTEPVVEASDGVNEQEFTEPVNDEVVEETTPELVKPERDRERDAWFAEQRRKLEAEKKESESRFNAQLEAERAKIAELETFRKDYEAKERETKLRQMAEETGVPYDELVEEVKRQEAAEKLAEDLENERQSKATLEEKIKQLESDLIIKRMEDEDKEYFRSQNIKPELDETFYKLRANGFTPEEAYYATLAKKKTVEVAPAPGKVNTVQADPELISEDDWDNMTESQKDKMLATDFEKVFRSQKKWLRK